MTTAAEGYQPPLREELEKEAMYLANNKRRLRFAALRGAGGPIGSGPTEAACKSVVAQRAKRSGQRWLNHGLAAALASRTQLLDDRLPVISKIGTAAVLLAAVLQRVLLSLRPSTSKTGTAS